MPQSKKKVILILGPTAVGKTHIAYLLAKKIKGEIISADSMQVYRQVPILTSHPSCSMLKSVPHHLVSILDLNKEYNVTRFIEDAKKLIKEILKKKRVPIVVGGSGLYINGLLDGIFSGPAEDKELRLRLEGQAQRQGNDYLYKRLKRLDPESASGIHPHNLRRLIRALEVCINSGRKMSKLKKNRIGICSEYEVQLIGLNRDRTQLYHRIEKRVDRMFNKGAVREAKGALRQSLSKTARQIIGLKEIAQALKVGYNNSQVRGLVKRNTRHFAKRQMTWFKRDRRIYWIDIEEHDKDQDIVRKIWNELY